MTFDLALGYPQWQGSARHENLPRGAAATAAVCARFAPLVSVTPSAADGDAHGVRRWDAIFDQFKQAQAILAEHRPCRLLTAGGDCAVDVAPIDYLLRLYPDLTVLWVDTHPDANSPATSPSGNFHGMPVSLVMGHAPEAMRALMGLPLDPARFRYFGVRAVDESDPVFRAGLRTLGADERLAGPVHIHFDLDVFDPDEFPYLAYGEPGGLTIDAGVALVRRVAAEAEIVGLTITEFAPAAAADAANGSLVIERLCEAATTGE